MSGFPEVFDEDELVAASLDAYDDALAATAWLRDHAAEHRLDPRAVVAAGGSAGGSNAWHLAWLPGGDVRPGPPAVAAALPLPAAPLDLAVPTGGAPPVLAFHGTADTVVRYAWATDACARAVAVGARCDVVAFDGAATPQWTRTRSSRSTTRRSAGGHSLHRPRGPRPARLLRRTGPGSRARPGAGRPGGARHARCTRRPPGRTGGRRAGPSHLHRVTAV